MFVPRIPLAMTFAFSALVSMAAPAHAEQRQTLGFGYLFDNDEFGDGADRWRSASLVFSMLRGPEWTGTPPEKFGELLEFRARAEFISPANLTTPDAGDRPYAGITSFGVHSHSRYGQMDVSIGGDLVFTGPQTGISDIHRAVHGGFGASISKDITDAQIPNGVHPTVTVELGREMHFGPEIAVRPFVETIAGAETVLRAGGDLVLGTIGRGELMLRDVTTGQLYRGIQRPNTGFTMVMGADIAKVFDTNYLISSDGYTISSDRARLRAGVHWQGEHASWFYGITYLGREIEEQPETQLIGSLRLNLKF